MRSPGCSSPVYLDESERTSLRGRCTFRVESDATRTPSTLKLETAIAQTARFSAVKNDPFSSMTAL